MVFIYCFDTSLLVWVSSHCSSSSNYLSPLLWFSPAFPHPSCWDWGCVLPHAMNMTINTPFCRISTFAAPFGDKGLPGPCSPPDLALKFSLAQKKTSQLVGICCDHCLSHWPISLLIILLCSPICQSVSICWVFLISFCCINSLEQRFLEVP